MLWRKPSQIFNIKWLTSSAKDMVVFDWYICISNLCAIKSAALCVVSDEILKLSELLIFG